MAHDPLGEALRRLQELENAPGGLLSSPAALVAVYDALQAASGIEEGSAVTSRLALSLAQSALNAFRDAAVAGDRNEAERLVKVGRNYLLTSVEAERLARQA
jgi:hypothetical protein